MTGDGVVRQRGGGLLVEFPGQLLHPLPRHQQRRRDNEHHRGAEQNLALGGEGDFEPSNPSKHQQTILSVGPNPQLLNRLAPQRTLPVVQARRPPPITVTNLALPTPRASAMTHSRSRSK